MLTEHPLPDPLLALIAERFGVLGEPMRILCEQVCGGLRRHLDALDYTLRVTAP